MSVPLTATELQVIKLLWEGKSQKQAGIILKKHAHTINTHAGNVYKKCDVSGLMEAVRVGLAEGWLDPPARK